MQISLSLFPCIHGSAEMPEPVVRQITCPNTDDNFTELELRDGAQSSKVHVHFKTLEEVIAFGQSIVDAAVDAIKPLGSAVPNRVPDPFMPGNTIDLDMVAETLERR